MEKMSSANCANTCQIKYTNLFYFYMSVTIIRLNYAYWCVIMCDGSQILTDIKNFQLLNRELTKRFSILIFLLFFSRSWDWFGLLGFERMNSCKNKSKLNLEETKSLFNFVSSVKYGNGKPTLLSNFLIVDLIS